MSFLEEVCRKTLEENERNLRFWEDYLLKLNSLNFNHYVDKLTVPILVPIGSRIFFRGNLKHTNEVTVSLGADYFAKCSLNQAEVLRQHRIKDAQSKVDVYRREREYVESRFSFTKQNISENQGQEIVEFYTNEEDIAWRVKHRENLRAYKGKQKQEETFDHLSDQELWDRLEELELQEELENELLEVNPESCYNTERNEKPFLIKDENVIAEGLEHKSKSNPDKIIDIDEKKIAMKEDSQNKDISEKKVTFKDIISPKHTSKLNLLQQVIDRQNELQNKLTELKNRDKSKSKTEEDLMSNLDDLELLEELEDEIDRLDDILDTEEITEKEEEVKLTNLQRRVSFADEDDSATLELTFTHSDIEPNNELYNPEKGIQKPSDIYQVYCNILNEETTSILKKTRYEENKILKKEIKFAEPKELVHEEAIERQTIVINDVIEKVELKQSKLEDVGKPISLFKKKRLQNKS
ncbi:hypothetical protein K1T71_002165 [Dendrolimus kikuchii]|uniref:Uncharacterized protein n=1 Tax=Dendrolimus kikuchii TaxID=765133 RepID=A0ACC1DFZ9_9NEOP|nr:hypothetical protein K1T71_002165 [Dendrolimus kikuchii]